MRTHIILLTLLLVIAFALRAWLPGRMAVEHFDEGVYASNFYSGHLNFRYPDRHLYAPPLLPAVYEWTLILTGSPRAVMWVNVLLGTGLVLAVWWLTQLIAGGGVLAETAALAAALLLTFDNFFIQYSRTALTDIPVCLFMVLAVGTGMKAIRSHLLWALPAAVFTALAWWTKYNGWLPLAIIGAGIGGWVVFDRIPKKFAIQGITRWCLIAVGAFLLWSPCLYALQDEGGYSAVASNHAGYVVGFSGWWDGVVRHFQVQQHYSQSSFLAAAAAVVLLQMIYWPISLTGRGAWWLAPLFILMTFYLGDLVPLVVLAGIGIISLRGESKKNSDPHASLGWWILLAWILGLMLTTPLYRPYPRLLAPLKIALIIAAGVGVVASLQALIGAAPVTKQRNAKPAKRLQIATVLAVFAIAQLAIGSKSPSYQDRDEFESMANEIISEIKTQTAAGKRSSSVDLDAIIYIIAEPGLYYHLASLDGDGFDFIVQPGSNLGMLQPGKIDPRVPTFLILGPHAKEEQEQLKEVADRITHLKDYEYSASDLVLLDDYAPSALDQHRTLVVQLWRVGQL